MEAKEKAKELVDKHYKLIDWDTTAKYEVKIAVAKQCALICVDEILKSDPLTPSKYNTKVSKGEAYKQSETEAYHFWQEVKNEINKL